jgi:cation transporter-like permease
MSTALDLSGYRVTMEGPDSDVENLQTLSSFFYSYFDRMSWLVGLMIFQSFSSVILASNEELLQSHPVFVNFLTVLVGAGGNAGSQATVRVIRGIAIGSLNKETTAKFIWSEVKMALCLCLTVGAVGALRCLLSGHVELLEVVAVGTSLVSIVFVAILAGVALPLLFQAIGLDPAHSSTAINVVMDIGGVMIIVLVASIMLETSAGRSVADLISSSGFNAEDMRNGLANSSSYANELVAGLVAKLQESGKDVAVPEILQTLATKLQEASLLNATSVAAKMAEFAGKS